MNTRAGGSALLIACLMLGVSVGFAGQGEAKPAKKTTRAADGLNLVYEIRGKGETTLLFLHGWCGDRHFWKHQVDVFAPDYRIVAMDLAGHGESGKDRKQWSATGLAADVETLVKALDLKRVILIGHSMGGPVALDVARRMPGTVVAVIGVDTLHNAEFKWPEELFKKFFDAFEADFKGSIRSMLPATFPPKFDAELQKWILTKAEQQDPKMAIGLMRDLSRLDAKDLLKNAKVPVRCINAAPATQFAIPTATEINKKYADFAAVIMEGVGHFPMLERPEEFNRKLRDVLKEFAAAK